MSLRKRDVAIEYPETDGEPVAETDVHIQLMFDLRAALQTFFRDAPEVYIASNLFIYYLEGNPGKRVAPDVFVVRGVSKEPRRIYKLWEESGYFQPEAGRPWAEVVTMYYVYIL